jgi:hypothetical protein
LTAGECGLWLGARDPETGQHYLKGHYDTGAPTAERTVSTTRSWISGAIPGQSGTEKFSAAARSVSGSEPGS